MIDWRFVSVAHKLSKTEMGGCLVEWWLPFYLNERKVKQSNAYKMNEQVPQASKARQTGRHRKGVICVSSYAMSGGLEVVWFDDENMYINVCVRGGFFFY